MPQATLPQIQFGDHTLSRLIAGSNTINGGSHLSRFVNAQMKRYFTPEQVQRFLAHCQELGINTYQSGKGNLDAYTQYLEHGKLHFLSLWRDDPDDPTALDELVSAGTIGVFHHGEVTDTMWKSGRIDQVREACKKIRDSGSMVGVSTHMPDVVDHILSEGWDVDPFMCCVYERHRTREELQALLGHVPIPVNEVYLEDDPPRMFKMMRQTEVPCLAFKILAAGRLCDKPEWTEAAFKATFEQIKANDAVIVGMYPEYEDQVALNAEYVRRFSPLSK
ncbi:MAG: hypothetical protein HN849_14645 [Victivallales bacterium]|nr:hypothetical protein [Victivallales bacterium]